MEKYCKVCGQLFMATNSRQIYCCKKCSNRARYSRSYDEITKAARLKKEMAVTLYSSDLSAGEIAERIGFSTVAPVYTAWREAGLPKRPTRRQRQIMELRRQGESYRTIAERLGMETKNVRATAMQLGCPMTESEKAKNRILINSRRKAVAAENAKNFIDKFFPDWEYIGGASIFSDGMAVLRHRACGTVCEKSAVTIRKRLHGRLLCNVCEAAAARQRTAQREKEKAEARRQAEISRKFVQISFSFHECAECGTAFCGKGAYCSDKCRKAKMNRRHDHRLDRAAKKDNSITLAKLYKRDKGVCWICGERCDYDDYTMKNGEFFTVGPNYPSIDHVVPLAKGGNHTWDNVRLAHHYCNTLKSDKVVGYD